MNSPLLVGDLINHHDANRLIRLVSSRDKEKSVHSVVMNWFKSDEGLATLIKFGANGYIPAYAAYLLSYYLKLEEM